MELRQLKTFQMVGRLLSFHRAAENLNYAPSTVSSQIKLLEEEFSTPLFDRIGKRIRLTATGRMLMRYSQKMLDIEKETLANISGWEEPRGTLSVRMPQSMTTYLLPAVLTRFREQYPRIGFDISTCAFDTLIHELQTGVVDVAFLFADSVPFAKLRTEPLKIEPLVLIAAPDHPLAGQPSFRLHDLTGQTILLPKHDCSYKMVFEQMLAEEKIGDTVFMEVNSVEAIKACVARGIGVAMVPSLAVGAEAAGLVVLPWSREPLETAVLMIWHRDKWLSPTVKDFMSIARQVIGEDPAYDAEKS